LARLAVVFNNITSWHLGSLARPAGAPDRSALPIAGNDPKVKAAVTSFLDAMGYDTIDTGAFGSGGRRFQFGTPAFVAPYGEFGDHRGTPAAVAAVRTALGI
jgi:predicted dinucleotide-binding enzyme